MQATLGNFPCWWLQMTGREETVWTSTSKNHVVRHQNCALMWGKAKGSKRQQVPSFPAESICIYISLDFLCYRLFLCRDVFIPCRVSVSKVGTSSLWFSPTWCVDVCIFIVSVWFLHLRLSKQCPVRKEELINVFIQAPFNWHKLRTYFGLIFACQVT